jgi:uncharacterized protein (DUF924 family)
MANSKPYDVILRYWFGAPAADPAQLRKRMRFWFRVNPQVDARIASQFSDLIKQASAGQLAAWEVTAEGRLALVVLLDQFRRNVYRGTSDAFSCDAIALALCRDGIATRMNQDLAIMQRAFFYMPLQHAEDLRAQEASVTLFRELMRESPAEIRPAVAEFYSSAKTHWEIISRFGRFPHRNAVLKRECTGAEAAYVLSERIPFKK